MCSLPWFPPFITPGQVLKPQLTCSSDLSVLHFVIGDTNFNPALGLFLHCCSCNKLSKKGESVLGTGKAEAGDHDFKVSESQSQKGAELHMEVWVLEGTGELPVKEIHGAKEGDLQHSYKNVLIQHCGLLYMGDDCREWMEFWVDVYCWHAHSHVKYPSATNPWEWQNLPRVMFRGMAQPFSSHSVNADSVQTPSTTTSSHCSPQRPPAGMNWLCLLGHLSPINLLSWFRCIKWMHGDYSSLPWSLVSSIRASTAHLVPTSLSVSVCPSPFPH